jgi:L-galactose dehydrogenase
MKYHTLGKTGLKVSRLAFGGSSLGSVFKAIDEHEGIRAVHVAIDHGINLIDTAPYYGATKAETVLGKALREIPRDQSGALRSHRRSKTPCAFLIPCLRSHPAPH